jgi:hypothetical protein
MNVIMLSFHLSLIWSIVHLTHMHRKIDVGNFMQKNLLCISCERVLFLPRTYRSKDIGHFSFQYPIINRKTHIASFGIWSHGIWVSIVSNGTSWAIVVAKTGGKKLSNYFYIEKMSLNISQKYSLGNISAKIFCCRFDAGLW